MITIKRMVTYEGSYTWTELKRLANEKKLSSALKSGDTIDITLKNGELVTLVVGKDLTGSIFFITKDCLRDKHRMNPTPSIKGGWERCEMRRYLNEDVFTLLPDDLQEVIKPTPIMQIVNGNRVEVQDKLFCLSTTQVFGPDVWTTNGPEDSRIDIFEEKACLVKHSGGWWLRSIYGNSNGAFYGIVSDAAYNYSIANASRGVAFGFTI